MPRFFGQPDFAHGEEAGAVGIVLANLGTPDAPESAALRRYLREFLLDPRVIEMPRALWWLILHLFVLTTRPRKSAALYRKVWTAEGSPLLVNSRRQAAALALQLESARGPAAPPVHVRLAMRYGIPSVRAVLRELSALGCRRLLVLPLYPQYAAVTIGSTFDAVAAELATWRWVPELRMVSSYHDDAAYVAALAATVAEAWADGGQPDKLLFSFHGIPQRYFQAGDPYFCHCHKTARLVAERLALPRERYEIAFQSLFGREEWLKPYTEPTIRAMARAGVRSLDVICPGFAADCLETIEEIDGQNREVFLHAGGERYRYIPALNDRPDHIQLLAELALRHLGGWIERAGQDSAGIAGRQPPPSQETNGRERAAEAVAMRRRAEEMKARPMPADAGY
ncbi:MAG TPA: ferrochelatase [Thermoanaerobaculia bacterium]|nr:ferrochelatase [Thermoanaerobaculia bacterium]